MCFVGASYDHHTVTDTVFHHGRGFRVFDCVVLLFAIQIFSTGLKRFITGLDVQLQMDLMKCLLLASTGKK